jgi:serine/threonine protein kinase
MFLYFIVHIGIVGGLFVLATLLFTVLLHKEKKKMRESFIKNGGPILQQVKSIQIFKKDELKRITKDYSQVLGKGNFGVVYKGFITDEVPVAVKKSNKIDKIQKEQFANEVIIQSQVIHKNIVRLLGCCLEVDIPILVYEFVSKGSLEDILHGKNKVPLTLDIRLRIAAESAEGLAYMHCKTSTSIQHGDVKPANILLDDNFAPKVSDFGISKLLARGKIEHADNVIGDSNYMDPVYRQTGLLTNKSDVYSFGLVLFELVTGKKAVYGGESSFVQTYLDTYITGIIEGTTTVSLDEGNAADTDVLRSIAGIAKGCLNIDVDQRPEMTDVAERLQNIRRARK